MAINPEISLGVRPPVIAPLQIQSPLEQFGKVLTLRNLMQEQQSGQIGLQANQLKLQQEQKGIQEDAAIRQLYATNPNPSHAEIISTIGPVRGAALIKSQSDQLQQFYKTEGERYNLLGRLAGSATDKTSAVDAVMRATASSAFDIDPQKNAETGRKLLDHLNTNGFNPAEFKQFQLQAMDAAQQHTAQLADVEDQRKAVLAPIELATKQAESEQKQRQIEASRLAPALARGAVAFQQELAKMKPERAALYSGFRDPSELYAFAMTPHEQVMAQQAAANAARQAVPNTPTELAIWMNDPKRTPEEKASGQAAMTALERHAAASRPVVNNIIPGVPTGPLTGAAADLHGEDYLKTLPPAFAARVRQTATGDLLAPTGRSANTGPGLQLMNALMQYDPQYSVLLGKGRTDTLKQFTDTHPGAAGGQVIALNTMLHHADLYLDAAAALKNGTFKPGNEIYNKVATMFGSAPPTNAGLLAQFFASETGKVATGGVPAEGEIKSILEKMSTSGSPEAMEGAGKTLIGIAAGRMLPLKDRRDKWKLDKLVDILGPDAKDVLQRRGFDPETMKPMPAGGGAGGAAGALPKGGGKSADASVITQFLNANGGDKAKARKALTDAGWTIPAAK